ncbi:MAG: ABC transporter substrate-binding protein [Methanomassiliicoccaceae archaeon]|nr:ABC transporter substrate-binding protein [Methanomassiliicoccaceae archaeon]
MIGMKIIAIAVAVAVVGGAAAAIIFWPSDDGGYEEGDITVVDDRGKSVTFAGPPERIMSLGSSFTDTLVTLGCMDRIYAVDQSSVNRLGYEYEGLSSKNVLSSGQPSASTAELALSYGIDCIIVWNFPSYAAGIDIIENAGIKVLALYPKDVESVKTVISTIGKVMGKDAAASELTDEIDRTIENITGLAKANAGESYGDHKRVYVELDAATPTSPAKGSITGSMLDILGVDYIGRSASSSVRYETEEIVNFNPDIMVFMGPRDQTDYVILRNNDLLIIEDVIIDIYRDGVGFNGNWASATPSFIKGLIYLYELIYEETYEP